MTSFVKAGHGPEVKSDKHAKSRFLLYSDVMIHPITSVLDTGVVHVLTDIWLSANFQGRKLIPKPWSSIGRPTLKSWSSERKAGRPTCVFEKGRKLLDCHRPLTL